MPRRIQNEKHHKLITTLLRSVRAAACHCIILLNPKDILFRKWVYAMEACVSISRSRSEKERNERNSHKTMDFFYLCSSIKLAQAHVHAHISHRRNAVTGILCVEIETGSLLLIKRFSQFCWVATIEYIGAKWTRHTTKRKRQSHQWPYWES